jgi:hypothetical protein
LADTSQDVRNQELLAADERKVPTLIAAIKKAVGPDSLLHQAEALASSR